MRHCEDFPACGHTPQDPCDPRDAVTEPWYCDHPMCGRYHYTATCPADDHEDEERD